VEARGNRDAIDRWFKAFNAKQFKEMEAILADVADAEVIQEWPQSGERIRGRDNIIGLLENFPGLPDATVGKVHGAEDKWVLTPSWTPLRVTGSGDHYTVEGRVAYPNGEVWTFVDVLEFRNGKVVKLTEYFGPPFPPAEWRARWVEKIEPAGR
jgi:ketosteroid isomerase-like protein